MKWSVRGACAALSSCLLLACALSAAAVGLKCFSLGSELKGEPFRLGGDGAAAAGGGRRATARAPSSPAATPSSAPVIAPSRPSPTSTWAFSTSLTRPAWRCTAVVIPQSSCQATRLWTPSSTPPTPTATRCPASNPPHTRRSTPASTALTAPSADCRRDALRPPGLPVRRDSRERDQEDSGEALARPTGWPRHSGPRAGYRRACGSAEVSSPSFPAFPFSPFSPSHRPYGRLSVGSSVHRRLNFPQAAQETPKGWFLPPPLLDSQV